MVTVIMMGTTLRSPFLALILDPHFQQLVDPLSIETVFPASPKPALVDFLIGLTSTQHGKLALSWGFRLSCPLFVSRL